jgi:deoxycytidine triphosphate deaminase
MDLLRDEEIYNLCIAQDNPIIEGIPERDKERLNIYHWYRKESPIQPSSIDLHIGNIYIPGKKGKEPGSECCPKAGFTLCSGETAVVVTQERLALPKDIAGIGFPPSAKMSFKGILMTNPGHIDPGYVGRLHFTLINMGKEEFALNRGDVLVSLLLFRLSRQAASDWLTRHDPRIEEPFIQEYLDLLSPDFMDYKKKSETIAKNEVQKAEFSIKKWSILTPIFAALIAALLTGGITYFGSISKMEKEIGELRASVGSMELKNKIEMLDQRLKEIEKRFPQKK